MMMMMRSFLFYRLLALANVWVSVSAFGAVKAPAARMVASSSKSSMAFLTPTGSGVPEWQDWTQVETTVPHHHVALENHPVGIWLADGGGGVLDILRNIALGLTAVVFLSAGLVYLVASVIIPAAAKELEKECLELAPELWPQYLARLEPGQTMAQRPDLMQELGSQLQPLIDAKVAAGGGTMGMGATTSPPPSTSSVAPDVITTTTPPVDVSSILSNKNQWDKDDDDGIVDAQIVFTENDDSKESTSKKE